MAKENKQKESGLNSLGDNLREIRQYEELLDHTSAVTYNGTSYYMKDLIPMLELLSPDEVLSDIRKGKFDGDSVPIISRYVRERLLG